MMTKQRQGRPQPPNLQRSGTGRPASGVGLSNTLLKSSLVVGSIAATIWGTNLVAQLDAASSMASDNSALSVAALAPPVLPVHLGTGITLSPITAIPIPTVRAPHVSAPTVGTEIRITAGAAPAMASKAPLNLEPIPQAIVSNVAPTTGEIVPANIDALLSLDLPAITAVQIPAPVTRSRSSR